MQCHAARATPQPVSSTGPPPSLRGPPQAWLARGPDGLGVLGRRAGAAEGELLLHLVHGGAGCVAVPGGGPHPFGTGGGGEAGGGRRLQQPDGRGETISISFVYVSALKRQLHFQC